ncbi:MAG: ATP-dependent RNA helicase HrpA, partial [Planctomycetales bacterium]|nr:ATP-dependent RNA helicase HrpA [Planctomycetales bacterium]
MRQGNGKPHYLYAMNDQEIEAAISRCMLKDRFRFHRSLKQLRSNPTPDRLVSLAETVQSSVDLHKRRSDNAPKAELDQSLPIAQHSNEIINALRERQVLVVAGQTGSGKSTQLPKLCLQAGFGISAMIGHTQPRRIAARSVASRIAEEMNVSFGREVGFKIRFTDKTDDRTYIKLMTDGILLAETQRDRFLEQYDVIILDEAHERSLNVDFLIGYTRQLLAKRRDLRVIVTSATLDAERFAEHFADDVGPAPIVEVSGRTYPVEVLYRPPTITDDYEQSTNDAILSGLDEIISLGSGDVLIFLPTEREIREVAKLVRARLQRHVNEAKSLVLPLYARLSAAEQNKIFQTGKHRRIVLATNVAESSLTVPGIRYVIDSGTARISRYSPRLKVQRLPIEAVSRASADQRKGRCGRIAPGVCVRVYSEEDYNSRDEFTTPEIRRTNLASVILQAKVLRLGNVEKIPFLDPPRPESIRDGYKTLFELGAVDDRREVTQIGKRLAELPVDPRIARMILAANNEGCLAEVLVIAAALEIQDPRERPHEKRHAADEQHEKLQHERSDFMSYLVLWDFYHELKEKLSRNQLRKACQQDFLSVARMHEWQEIYRQLRQLVIGHKMRITSRRDHAAIHRALLTGLLSGVAHRTSDNEYTGAGGVKFHLWPGSGLFRKRPEWIVVGEIVETSRRYGRTVASINPAWIEPIAEHILKRSYSDPHWHVKSESVMAYEKVSLFGLPIVAKRRTRYGNRDPEVARQIFIQRALVENAIRSEFPFLKENRAVLSALDELAAKTRKREYLINEYAQYAFYDRCIPEGVFDVASLRQWLRKASKKRNASLQMALEDFIDDQSLDSQEMFPQHVDLGSIQAPVEYNFRPGDEDDGVTMTVPVEGLNLLNQGASGWLVPGLVEEKVVALIRSLPKSIRRNLVPAPDTAKRVAAEMRFGEGNFYERTAELLSRIAEEPITPADFRRENLPTHLTLNVKVVDAEGDVLSAGRDITKLREDLGEQAVAIAEQAPIDTQWHRDGITEFDFDELPKQVVVGRGGIDVTLFPALIDAGDSVKLRLLTDGPTAKHEIKFALMRLLLLAKKKAIRSQVRWLPGWEQVKIHAASRIKPDELEQAAGALIAVRAVSSQKPLPLTRDLFQHFLNGSTERIGIATQEVANVFPKIFGAYHEARLVLEQARGAKSERAVQDIKKQMKHLFAGDFLFRTPFVWLSRFPCYFEAMIQRLDKLRSGHQDRDSEAMAEIDFLWSRYEEKKKSNDLAGIYDRELEEYRWMLEEYRVSRYAQSLGTIVKIS